MKNRVAKFIYIVLIISCFGGIYSANAQQGRIYLDSIQSGLALGTSISISIRANGFNSILGFQGSLVWDTTFLKYTGIGFGNNTSIQLDASNVNIATDYLSFLWATPGLNAESVPDTTILITINFVVLKGGVTNSSVALSDKPTPLQIIDSASVMPISFKNITGIYKEGIVNLDWSIGNEIVCYSFTIQRSVDGSNFVSIGAIKIANSHHYNYRDKLLPAADNIYYRIKSTDKDGSNSFSSIISIKLPNAHNHFSVYPNPVVDCINVQSVDNGEYTVRILNLAGKLVYNRVGVAVVGNKLTLNISSLPAAPYFIELTNRYGNKQMDKFIKD